MKINPLFPSSTMPRVLAVVPNQDDPNAFSLMLNTAALANPGHTLIHIDLAAVLALGPTFRVTDDGYLFVGETLIGRTTLDTAVNIATFRPRNMSRQEEAEMLGEYLGKLPMRLAALCDKAVSDFFANTTAEIVLSRRTPTTPPPTTQE
jgi:hypothetical protein